MVSICVKFKTFSFFKVNKLFYVELSQDDDVKMLVLKWSKVFDGVQLIRNRLQQDVQLHSEFKGLLFIASCFDLDFATKWLQNVMYETNSANELV